MSFLGALADQISSQFSLGENTNHTLDSINPDTGKTEKYGSLGDFAKNFDQSAERRYVEEGFLRKDPYNTDPKQFEVLMQEPNATVLIKKRMFSSVGENYRPDFMDKDEKLYYRAMKILFQNKCKQIGALEKLSKIQKITQAVGSVPDQLMPIIFTLTDSFNSGLDTGSNLFGALGGPGPMASEPSNFTKTIDRLRRIYAFNSTSPTTTWITDSTNLFQAQFGAGTGVMEITNFSNLSTSVNVDGIASPGSFQLTINDPYESMLITEYDIEKAISDATNMFYNRKIYQFAKTNSETLIQDLIHRLNEIRSKRLASPISFKLDPDTLLGRRVTVILDRRGIEIPFDYDSSSLESIVSGGAFGKGVSVPDEYLRGGAIAGEDGLDTRRQKFSDINNQSISGGLKNKGRTHFGPDSELSIFGRLISTIYSKISLEANSKNSFQTHNKDTNYARRKLRFNFCGKLIIQPMDVVHIYMNSKSRFDNRLLSGLQNMFTGLGMLQNLNNTLTNLTNAAGALNPNGNVPLQIEKSVFVGSDFPSFLWNLVRGNFVSENEGTHVFAGIVDHASDNWADGKFSIAVNGKDNTAYFDHGKVNFKPAVDVFNGAFYDPLTPFKTKFDTITSNTKSETPELLDENKYLLGSSKEEGANSQGAALVKYKLGRYAGKPFNADDIKRGTTLDRNVDPVTGRITKIFYAPDGLVYKWKEGIGVFVQYGSDISLNDPAKVGNPSITKEPFAGQDVMNVLSLLVTGTPYNFVTYYKAAIEFDGAYNDPQTKQNSAHSFYQSIKNELVKNNTLWGNFVPFKNLVVDEESYKLALTKQVTVVQKNRDLDNKLQTLQTLNDAAIIQGAANIFSETTKYSSEIGSKFADLKEARKTLEEQIQTTIAEINKNDTNNTIQQVGDDISFDATEFVDSGKSSKTLGANRRLLRRQLNFLTRRMSYNVRANEDKNLFIVDDFYDKDFDILAYEKSLAGEMALYNNEFTTVRQKIQQVSQLLNLEVFADTQGHIRVRPPQYNRMPSSIFYRMMYLKDVLGIQVFPQFLDDMFNNKLETLRTRIEVLEDEIRLDCAVLSINTDEDCVDFVITQGGTNNIGDSFAFISDEDTGQITEIQDLTVAANPGERDDKQPQDLVIVDKRKNKQVKISTKDIFTNAGKYSAIVNSLKRQEHSENGFPMINAEEFQTGTTRVNDLITRLHTKTGQRVDKRDYLIKRADQVMDVQPPTNTAIDVFKVVQELSEKIRDRQKAMKLFYSTLKNAREFQSLDDDKSTSGKLLTPGVYGKSSIPEVFEHMIEDETYDDLGLNSGKRFIIKRSQIKSLTIAENPPPYTSVHVQGRLDPFYSGNDSPGFAGAFPASGNGLTSAIAIDYDMWRTYGLKEDATLVVPFLKDPASQAGPYATMILSRNRKNIFKGTVTISGNEFMQPGEVVWLEDRQMLFYVNSVKHNFTYGGSFTTTLDLTYGHTPGEYIPTTTDMIGKLIYNNKDAADLAVHRQSSSSNELSLGVVQRGTDDKSGSLNNTVVNQATPEGFTTTYSAQNAKVINNVLYDTKYLLNANEVAGDDTTAKIEIRIYHDDKNSIDPDVRAFANQIRDLLTGVNEQGLNSFSQTKQGSPPKPLDPEQVEVTEVNLDDLKDRRSPSQKAIDAARNNKAAKSLSGGGASSPGNNDDGGAATKGSANGKLEKDKIRAALFKYIVDCWLIKVPNSTTSNG